jgi:hypothetical protein
MSRIPSSNPLLRGAWIAWRIVELSIEANVLARISGDEFTAHAALKAAQSAAVKAGIPRDLLKCMLLDALKSWEAQPDKTSHRPQNLEFRS